eukprot:11186398-Lingulodinium_polyedra.AAC.1
MERIVCPVGSWYTWFSMGLPAPTARGPCPGRRDTCRGPRDIFAFAATDMDLRRVVLRLQLSAYAE